MAGPEQMMQIAAQAAQAAADAAASMKEFIAKDLANKQRFGEAGKVVKMPESFGSEDHEADQRCWRDFLLNFKSWLYYADPSFEVGLTNVEKNPIRLLRSFQTWNPLHRINLSSYTRY